jgi:hypothetical protein
MEEDAPLRQGAFQVMDIRCRAVVRSGLLALGLAAGSSILGQWSYTGNTAPTWAEAIDEYRELAHQHARQATLSTIGADDNGQPIHLFVLHDGTPMHPDSARAAGKRVVWINNAIHAGEPDGVQASLLLARALLHSDQYMGLLARTVVCIVPVYNVSGYMQRSSTTRVNQVGPEEYGFRANARHLDLNRDFIKADARNTRDLLQALARWDPDLFLDTHVSNGADHRHVMELLATHTDRLDPPLARFLEQRMKPGLYQWMERRAMAMCPYFETVRDHPQQGMHGFIDGPRYSTGHATLRQRLGIMVETHMLKPYEDRVNATFELLLAALSVMDEHGEELLRARAQARQATAHATSFDFNHRIDTTQVEWLPWKGYRAGYKPSAVSGLPRLYYDRAQPIDTVVPWMDHAVPTLTLTKPTAYLIPQEWHEVVRRLRLEAVPMEVVRTPRQFTGEVQYIRDMKTGGAPYEGHHLHRDVTTEVVTSTVSAHPGDVLVPMGHDTDRLVMEILEPRAADSFFAWGFFDSVLQQKEWFSPYVFEDIAADLLDRDPTLRQALDEKRAADPAFAADAWQQLLWVYLRSPHHEPGHRRYPVVRIVDQRPSLRP